MNDHLSEAETRCSPGPTSGPHRPSVPDHELIRCIGRGSYGEVWLAKNVLGTFRAVKVIFRRRFHDARPFEREFLGIQKYEPVSRTHESLVHILHVGCDEPDGYFPPDGPGTPQADIYSLGKVLYEIATGRDRSKFPELPTDLEDPSSDKRFFEFNAVILKACHQNAAARYQSVQALLVDLMRVETGQSVKIAQPSGWLAKIGGLFQLGRQEPPAPQAVPETVAVLSAGDVLKVAYTEQPPSPSEAAEKPQLLFEVWARLKGESCYFCKRA